MSGSPQAGRVPESSGPERTDSSTADTLTGTGPGTGSGQGTGSSSQAGASFYGHSLGPPPPPASALSGYTRIAPGHVLPVAPHGQAMLAQGAGEWPRGLLPDAPASMPPGGQEERPPVLPANPDESAEERRQLKKTEMNRKAQQRYRRRKKEMFEEQQRLNVELSMKCNELARDSAHSQARTYFLENMLDAPHQQLDSPSQSGAWPQQPSMQAFADAMLELLHSLARDQDPAVLRQLLMRATSDMIDGNGSTFSFLRKLLVEELAKCFVALSRPNQQATYSTLCSLINTYVSMIQRAGAANLRALLTYLSLVAVVGDEKPPPADWPSVLVAMQLTQGQVRQLSDAHGALSAGLARLASTRSSVGSLQSLLGPSADSMTHHVQVSQQGEHCLDLFCSSIAQERQLIFDFLKLALLVLDPVQHAHGLLASFPHAPDMLAICALLTAPGPDRPPSYSEQESMGTLSGAGPSSANYARGGPGSYGPGRNFSLPDSFAGLPSHVPPTAAPLQSPQHSPVGPAAELQGCRTRQQAAFSEALAAEALQGPFSSFSLSSGRAEGRFPLPPGPSGFGAGHFAPEPQQQQQQHQHQQQQHHHSGPSGGPRVNGLY